MHHLDLKKNDLWNRLIFHPIFSKLKNRFNFFLYCIFLYHLSHLTKIWKRERNTEINILSEMQKINGTPCNVNAQMEQNWTDLYTMYYNYYTNSITRMNKAIGNCWVWIRPPVTCMLLYLKVESSCHMCFVMANCMWNVHSVNTWISFGTCYVLVFFFLN